MSTRVGLSANDIAVAAGLHPLVTQMLLDFQLKLDRLTDIRSGTIALGASSVTISDSRITAASKVMVSLSSNDTTLKSLSYTVALGSITIRGNANATATCNVNYLLI